MKFTQWIAAAGVAAGVLVGSGGAAWAAPGSNAPTCPDGVLTVVTDENGVQHEACVAVAVETPAAPIKSTLTAPVQAPTPGTASGEATLPATGATTGGLIIAALLVGCGSLVSLLSRRKPLRGRKGFRRRRATP